MLEPSSSHLVAVAGGRREANLYIHNCRVLNIYSGEVLTDVGVAIAGGRVAYVGTSREMVGAGTQMIDAGNGILVPGYVEPHSHFDLIVSLGRMAEAVLPLGTTTVVNDTLAMVGRFGKTGLDYLRTASATLPLHVYFMASPTSLAPELEELGYPAGAGLSAAELAATLDDDRVLGTGESLPWRKLLAGDPYLTARLELACKRGRRRQGHFPGARADHVQALAAAGFTDCHEALTAEEALDRLRAGLYVILRHGPARPDLPALATLIRHEGVDRSRLMFTTDWVPPADLVKTGHLNHVIATALELGVSPIDAYRMATLNPAQYLGVEDDVGAIAPGRYADILCIASLQEPFPRWVMASGRVVARNGRTVAGWDDERTEPVLPPYRPPVIEARASDFRMAISREGSVVVPAIEMVGKTVTRRKDLRLVTKDGVATLEECGESILKMAMPKPGGGFAVGFLVGMGAPLGGFSTSVASDPYHTLVIGSNDHDMATAYNRMVANGGGIVAVHQGQIAAELPLPVGGFISTAPVTEIAADIEALNRWAQGLGCPWEDIFLIQRYFTYIGVPFFRMTPWGIYDVKERDFLPPVLD